ncbi:hypothetical protein PSm6_48820 [Pseudomonas solani]|uniref:Single Cache domain-containing protein n=1 Tax=Pseudomonas solani TaxID=2731552 RepID=A0ABM7LFW7_9PSED|nr:hypothetical protein PSm6_48820 [Pseudomonas solani]
MNRLSIRQKILLLALLPVLALATISAWLFVSQARELRDLSRDDLRESLLAAKREQLANYMELALSAVAPLANGDSAAGRERIKEALRSLRFDGGSGYFFAYDSQGVQVMSADNPAREGTGYWDSTSPEGRHLVREYVEAGAAGVATWNTAGRGPARRSPRRSSPTWCRCPTATGCWAPASTSTTWKRSSPGWSGNSPLPCA